MNQMGLPRVGVSNPFSLAMPKETIYHDAVGKYGSYFVLNSDAYLVFVDV